MIGQAYSIEGKKYNVIILSGGAGSRMGVASDYIPKALSQIGGKRAIDYIIEKHLNIAHKFIIGVAHHSDLMISYIKGRYPGLDIAFSIEKPEELKNNGYSTLLALDHADSRYGTIISFCDLIVVGNNHIQDDILLVATTNTNGKIGTFRHSIDSKNNLRSHYEPVTVSDDSNGILGYFVIGDTPLFKKIGYGAYNNIADLTHDIVYDYYCSKKVNVEECDCVYEFGNENDLKEVRRLWESV